MTMRGYYIKNIGANRGRPRVWLQGLDVSTAGLKAGDTYSVSVKGGSIVLRADPNGDRVVSLKSKNDKQLPVIDLNSAELLGLFEGMDAIRMVHREGEIYLSPIPTELRKKDRLRRLALKLQSGQPLSMGSLSHGGGVLTHAIHTGLQDAGVATELTFANEIRADLIEHAARNNSTWTQRTIPIAAPMQEFAFDPRAMNNLPQVEILEAGLPCSGASKSGRARRGTAMAEEHPEVGHLVVAALMIIGRANPAIFVLENVVPYASTASAAILRNQLRDLGYATHETVLSGADFGANDSRTRWCMVAATQGLHFSWDMLQIPNSEVLPLHTKLDDIGPDDPAWSRMQGLKDKQERDTAAGKNFKMKVYGADATNINTLTKGYMKVRTTDPKLAHPTDPELLRQFTAYEHARFKQVPPELIAGLSSTIAHELLGQGINYTPFKAAGAAIAQTIHDFAADLGIPSQRLNDLSQAMAAEMLDSAERVVSEIRKPIRGVRYEGPITVLDVGMAIQDIGNNVGILYRLDQLVGAGGRIPQLGDVIEVVQRLGRSMDVRWLDEAQPAPAVSHALQQALGDRGYPPIAVLTRPAHAPVEPTSYSFEF
jgi:DNA (cytosine-5)-methyltransferase 1